MTNIGNAAFFREKIDLAAAATRERPRIVLCRTFPQQVLPRITRTFFHRLVLVLSGSRLCRYGDGKQLVDRRIVPGDVLLIEPRASLWNEEEGEYELLSIVVSYNFIRLVSKRRRTGEAVRFDPDAVCHCGAASRDSLEELLHALSPVVDNGNEETAADILNAVWSLCRFALAAPGEQPGNASHRLLEEALALLPEALTKGFHLDGLADTADGFLSGRSRERKLEIMRDSRIGSMGVAAIFAQLGMKFALFASIPAPALPVAAGIMMLSGRCGIVLYNAMSRYARPEGLGAIWFRRRPVAGIVLALLLPGVWAWWFFGVVPGSALAVVLLLFSFLWSRVTKAVIGGATC